uniref:PEP-CTERM protein-sorting domain-containing protein n=1 Tax=Solibacter usitatus (strain Ellin6076) TaxID=234267 RepID=Q01YA9_SOLUE
MKLITLTLAGLLAASAHAAPLLNLDPISGNLSGLPGSTVGWGFTITNTMDFLVVTGASFVPVPLSSFGTFTDFISTGPLIVVGPAPESATITQAFNAITLTGIGAFHIVPTAAGSVSGTIVINYALFSVSPNDPSFNPDIDLLVPDGALRATASVTAATAAPEPATLGLVAFALLLIRFTPARR